MQTYFVRACKIGLPIKLKKKKAKILLYINALDVYEKEKRTVLPR